MSEVTQLKEVIRNALNRVAHFQVSLHTMEVGQGWLKKVEHPDQLETPLERDIREIFELLLDGISKLEKDNMSPLHEINIDEINGVLLELKGLLDTGSTRIDDFLVTFESEGDATLTHEIFWKLARAIKGFQRLICDLTLQNGRRDFALSLIKEKQND